MNKRQRKKRQKKRQALVIENLLHPPDPASLRFSVDERVQVKAGCGWIQTACGTICAAPDFLVSEFSPLNYTRQVPGRLGPIRTYWIRFDEPQQDADGDGPYREAEISEDALDFLFKE